MGQSAGAASGLSIASAGLSAFGAYEKGAGTAAADTYEAELAQRAGEYGQLKAVQTNAQSVRNLSITLGHIDAVRAAAHTDPTSPTGMAVRGAVEQTETEQKNIKVDSIMAQAQEDEANAAYLRSASSNALLMGDIGAGATLLGGVAGAFKPAA
jgi:hypothetical protein